jgi:hypothetical protein
MTVHWYRVKKTYAKPQGGFLAIGPRYPGVLSDDGLVVLFTHPGDAQVNGGGSRRASSGGTGGAEAASTWEVVRRDVANCRSKPRLDQRVIEPEKEHAATIAAPVSQASV